MDFVWEFVLGTLRFIVGTYIGGIVCLAFGLYLVYDNLKNPMEIKLFDPLQGEISGWFGAIGFIVLGVLIIAYKMNGNI